MKTEFRELEWWEEDFPLEQADGPASAPKPIQWRFIKVPNDHLGRILDGGKASKYAVQLLLIKIAMGPEWVLNEKHIAKTYGLGRRAFRAGLRRLQETGLLDRRQQHARRYAIEQLASSSSHRFTTVPFNALTESSDVVAFTAAVNLQREAISPSSVGSRIGIRCDKAIARMTARSVEIGAIELAVGPHGKKLVARKGTLMQFRENVPSGNGPGENVPAQARCKGSREDVGNTIEKKDISVRPAVACRQHASEGLFAVREKQPIALTHWMRSKLFQSDEADEFLVGLGDQEPGMFIQEWAAFLDYYGGAPSHLKTRGAFLQAIEIADHLTSYHYQEFGRLDDEAIPMRTMLKILASEIAQAHRNKREIRSLALIADPLFRSLYFDRYTGWLDAWLVE